MKHNYFIKSLVLGILGLTSTISVAQTYNFTNCGQEGAFGPDQTQIDAEYLTTNLNNDVTVNTDGIQEWIVPVTGMYNITTIGSCGGELQGSYYPGLPGTGATIAGDFNLTAGTVLKIVVGQKGTYDNNGSGGGGGSFVYTGMPQGAGIMIVAGGGGGHGHGSSGIPAAGANGGGGSATTSQVESAGGNGNGGSSGIGQGGNNGVGCNASGHGSGGTGWLSNGLDATCGNSTGGSSTTFNGGVSGQASPGGFGGGGGTDGGGTPGGGGGGYTGGGGGNTWTGNVWGAGAGAGSYNLGTNQTNTAGVTGAAAGFSHGSVSITLICSNDLTTTLTDFTIASNDVSGTYQWINCSDNSEVSGATNQSYTADANGDYAVIVTNGVCSDTSDCVTIAGVGVDSKVSHKFNIYPNPTTGKVQIISESPIKLIEIYNIGGKKISTFDNTANINLSDLTKGVYFIKITNTNNIGTMQKLIKE